MQTPGKEIKECFDKALVKLASVGQALKAIIARNKSGEGNAIVFAAYT